MYIHPMVLFLERTLTKTGSAYFRAAGLVTSLFQSQCSGKPSGYWLLTQVGRGQGSNRGLFAGIQEKKSYFVAFDTKFTINNIGNAYFGGTYL